MGKSSEFPKDLRALAETIDHLAAYDDDTSEADLRGNLNNIREQCGKILGSPHSPSAPRRRYVVRTSCEFSVLIEATSPEAAMGKAEHLDFDKHWEKSWSEFEAEEEA